jgi:hypothetical protein
VVSFLCALQPVCRLVLPHVSYMPHHRRQILVFFFIANGKSKLLNSVAAGIPKIEFAG